MAASKIDIKKVRIDLGTQSRVTIDTAIVTEYAEAMERGEVFPPIKVYYDMEQDIFILVDGFHRYLAWIKTFPNDDILAEQVLGSVREAVWESFSVNKSHGLQRTNADKRKAVEGALMHPNGVKMSDRAIAKHVGVHHQTVTNIRKELESSGEIRQMEIREVQRGDQVYTQNTANIGTKPKTVIGTDGIEYPKPDRMPDRLPWQTEPSPDDNTNENYATRLAECSGRMKNVFKRRYDVKNLRCSQCILYEDMDGAMVCANNHEPRAPEALVCDYFDYCPPYTPPEPKPVENLPLVDNGEQHMVDRSEKLRRTYGTYERRNTVEVRLPRADPEYFVQVLLLNFEKDYLATVLPKLHQRLLEKDDDD